MTSEDEALFGHEEVPLLQAHCSSDRGRVSCSRAAVTSFCFESEGRKDDGISASICASIIGSSVSESHNVMEYYRF